MEPLVSGAGKFLDVFVRYVGPVVGVVAVGTMLVKLLFGAEQLERWPLGPLLRLGKGVLQLAVAAISILFTHALWLHMGGAVPDKQVMMGRALSAACAAGALTLLWFAGRAFWSGGRRLFAGPVPSLRD